MVLIINHVKKYFEELPKNVEALMLSEFPEKTKGIAVALNGKIITKANRAETALNDGDTILIITATQGG